MTTDSEGVEALREARRLCDAVKIDLAAAHTEICKLQNIDPATHSWPEWSSPANTLRWVESKLIPMFDASLSSIPAQQDANLRSDCKFLLSVIDSCNEAGSPPDEMDPEDLATIAQIRADFGADAVLAQQEEVTDKVWGSWPGPSRLLDYVLAHDCGHKDEGQQSPLVTDVKHTLAEIDKALAAPPSVSSEEAWEPIETAPKDGTDILVVHRDNRSFQQIVCWTNEYGAPYRWEALDGGPRYHEDAFDYWQPLPAPPIVAASPNSPSLDIG